MPYCTALECRNSDKKGVLMKRFPRDPIRRNEWLIKMRRGFWKPTDHSCLCEDHFAPEMWEKPRVDGKRVLKCNAVPTIFASSSTQPRSQRKPVSQKKSHFLHDAVLASSAGPSTSSLHLPQQEPKSLPEVSDKSSTSKVDSGVHPPASQKTSNSKCTSCNKNLPEILKKYRLLYLRERRKVAQYKKLLQIQHEKQTIKNE